jgi:hypothetical protein
MADILQRSRRVRPLKLQDTDFPREMIKLNEEMSTWRCFVASWEKKLQHPQTHAKMEEGPPGAIPEFGVGAPETGPALLFPSS